MKAPLYILYGSRTGRSRAAAVLARDYAEYMGIDSRLIGMHDFKPEEMKGIRDLLIAVSTDGEGDPPLQAEPFYEYIHSPTIPEIQNLRYAVLALGDSSYKHFCKTGKDIAKRMNELGAEPLYPLIECDIDFEDSAKQWVRNVVDKLSRQIISEKGHTMKRTNFVFELKSKDDEGDYFRATVLNKELLTGKSSTKRIYNLRLDLKNSGLEFHSGDSFGLFCPNSKMFVNKIIRELGYDPTHVVTVKGRKMLLKDALVYKFELTMITPIVVEKYARIISNPALDSFMARKRALMNYIETRDILDLVSDFKGAVSPEAFISILRKLMPRLYSLASSSLIEQEKIDLAVGVIEYSLESRDHIGVCSSFIADRLEKGEKIPIKLESNEKFRLPENPLHPVIMIGTGTGVSPFRAFLQERKIAGNTRNWLFFGERNSATDFIYGRDFLDFEKSGILTRLDTAFSRDQANKIYISHKIQENSKEFFRWLEDGAYVYLCGNKRIMAKDVRMAILRVLREEAHLTDAQAVEYLDQLKKKRRFQEDVY